METEKEEKITGVFVEIGGDKVNIRDLKKEDYEEFLNTMNKVRLLYIATIKR